MVDDQLALALEDFDDEDDSAVHEDESDFEDEGLESAINLGTSEWLPAATFDVLFLTRHLGEQSAPSRMALHTFAYLACLMSVFKGSPASEWGYSFSAVPPTLPFSPAIESAIATLRATRGLSSTAKGGDEARPTHFELTETGQNHLKLFEGLRSFSTRIPYLRASARTAVFTSLPAVINSVTYEPQLAQALTLSSPRTLLTEVTAEPLYREFDALLTVLGPQHEELVVPASLYVSFLQERALRAGTDDEREATDG